MTGFDRAVAKVVRVHACGTGCTDRLSRAEYCGGRLDALAICGLALT